MNSDAGSSGSGGDGNGNDVGTCSGKYSDDGRGGSGGEGWYGDEGSTGAAKHLVRCSSTEGGDKPLTTVLVEMRSVQPMSLSKTPVKRYANLECRSEYYIHATPSELPNSIPLTVPKPLEKLKPPAPSTTESPGETIYP
nr:hypothetical protein [Tanacetum cinerariifolium]